MTKLFMQPSSEQRLSNHSCPRVVGLAVTSDAKLTPYNNNSNKFHQPQHRRITTLLTRVDILWYELL